VRKGAHIIISDRDTPIAEVVPYDAVPSRTLVIRPPLRKPFALPPTELRIPHDPVEYLMQDRDAR
jgi:antitoxin (DNA-binding transcriptional repressor) of toxin-antitoxin stability system